MNQRIKQRLAFAIAERFNAEHIDAQILDPRTKSPVLVSTARGPGPCGEDQHDRRVPQAAHQQVQYAEANLIGPIEVIDDEEDRVLLCHRAEEFVGRFGEPEPGLISDRLGGGWQGGESAPNLRQNFRELGQAVRTGCRGPGTIEQGFQQRPDSCVRDTALELEAADASGAGALERHGGGEAIRQGGLSDSAVALDQE